MGAGEDYDEFEQEYGPLVDRLRNMKWPEVPAEVRERCWRDFQRRVGEDGFGPRTGEPASEQQQ